MQKYYFNIRVVLFGSLIVFISGVVLGYSLFKTQPASNADCPVDEIHAVSGTFISPLLQCDISSPIGSKEFSAFEQQISEAIDRYTASGKATHIAVYFRHLLDGAWFGINEKVQFTPASLLKVPVLIAVLKQADSDPDLLREKLIYDQIFDPVKPYFMSKEQLEIGKTYTIEDLVSRMIKYSDNESMYLVRKRFDASFIDTLYRDLKLIPPDDTYFNDSMRIKDYASFFRILFNATYLSPSSSTKALELLSTIEFDQGISAQLPPGITVAHKFGERTYTDDNSKQLHDCGIIYYPGNPYLLCIMTKGSDFDTLASVIREISKTIFQEVQSRSKELR